VLQFINATPFPGRILLLPDPEGIDTVYAVLKGTFALAPGLPPVENQVPILDQDEFLGEPGQSSLRSASDVALIKPGTDVVLVGAAYPPEGRRARHTEVSMAVGPIRKSVRVFGDRHWRAGSAAPARPSDPEPFERMPLTWERAFGGADQTDDRPPRPRGEDRNPVGLGFRLANGQKTLDGLRLPNLEDPRELIGSWEDSPPPAGFAPLCPHWEPRRSYAGTYDEEWQRRRAPYLPRDFDRRFFQVAPPDQVAPEYLRGGEPVEVVGASPRGPMRFHLPAYRVEVAYALDARSHVRPARLDTVSIEPDDARLVLVWRAALACDKKALRVRSVEARACV
jgi:hypothetical protein